MDSSLIILLAIGLIVFVSWLFSFIQNRLQGRHEEVIGQLVSSIPENAITIDIVSTET